MPWVIFLFKSNPVWKVRNLDIFWLFLKQNTILSDCYEWFHQVIVTLPSEPQHPQFFGAFEVTFLMLQVCFKPITWYIEVHHMRTFFLCGIMTLPYLWDIHSQSVYLQEKSLLRFLFVIELSSIAAVYQLKIKIIHMIRTNLMHFLDTFSLIKIQWAFLSKINTL